MPLIPAFGRQRQEDHHEFEASLVYRVSSRTAKATQRNLVLKRQKQCIFNYMYMNMCMSVQVSGDTRRIC